MTTLFKQRGAFILIEGPDHSGKTTQCELLAEQCRTRNISVKIQKFPDRSTNIGKIIDLYLKGLLELEDHAIHLLFSANRWEISEKIRKDLENGVFIILDRYIYSGIAFSVAKGMDIEWCKAPDKGLPHPDCVIYLDISQEEACLRKNYGIERYETDTMQERVRSVFQDMFKRSDSAYCPWYWVDASMSILQVKTVVWNAVQNTMNIQLNNIREFC